MKVVIPAEPLRKALAIVARAVPARPEPAVLANLLLRAQDGRLYVAATDLELSLSVAVPATVAFPGAVTVPAKTLVDLVSAVTADMVELDLVERTHTLTLAAGRSRANIKGIDAQEFPLIPALDPEQALELDAADLRAAINQVAVAAATDEARPILRGVQILVRPAGISLRAADGFRLALRDLAVSDLAAELSAVVPARSLRELARLPVKDGDSLRVQVADDRILFSLGGCLLVSGLLAGAYPDLTAVIPKPAMIVTVVRLETADLVRACRSADVIARDSTHHIVRVLVDPGPDGDKGQVTVKATSAELGDSEVVVEADVSGPGLEIAFNCRYLQDALTAGGSRRTTLEFINPTSPGTIHPEGRRDFVYVTMPMSIG